MGMTIEAIEINRQFPVYQDQILRDLRKKTIAQNDTVGKSLENQNNSSGNEDELDTTPQNQTDPIENPKSYYEGGLDQAESVINNEQLKFDKQPEYKPPSNSSEATGSLTPGGKPPGQSGPPKEFTDADEKIKHSGLTRRDGTTIPAPAGPNAAALFKIFCDNTIVYAQDQIVRYGNTTTGGSEGTTQAESYGNNLNKSSEDAAIQTGKEEPTDPLSGDADAIQERANNTLGGDHFDENAKGYNLNTKPPASLQNNNREAAEAVAYITEGYDISIVSGYRNPAYNAAVGGEDGSKHLENRAIDFSSNVPRDVFVKRVQELRNQGYSIGYGVYSWGYHVDNGSNRSWKGRGV